MAIGGFAISLAFQVATYYIQGLPTGPLATDTVVACIVSGLTIVLARAARGNHLLAVWRGMTGSRKTMQDRRSLESMINREIVSQRHVGRDFSMALLEFK